MTTTANPATIDTLGTSLSPLDAAKEISPLVDQDSDAIEAAGKLTNAVVEALTDTRLFWMLVPSEYGGLQCSGREAVEVLEQISYADSSAGWALMANAYAAKLFASSIHPDAIGPVMTADEPAIMAGMLMPAAQAKVVPGGYQLTGKFQFASGSEHSNWIGVGFTVVDGNGQPLTTPDGGPVVRSAMLPRKDVELLGNWNVMGLRGTGSYDYAVNDKFVPEEYAFNTFAPEIHRHEAMYHVGSLEFATAGHAGVVLGIAKRALAEVVTATKGKSRMGYTTTVGESEVFRYEFGRHEAAYQAARRYVLDALDQAEAAVARGAHGLEFDSQIRQAAIFAHETAKQVSNFAHEWGGSASIRDGSRLGRCTRDMAVACQHLLIDKAAYGTTASVIIEGYTQH